MSGDRGSDPKRPGPRKGSMTFRAITFDCYGTLIDWEAGASAFIAAWALRHGLSVGADALLGPLADAQRRHQAHAPFKPYRDVLKDAFLDLARAEGVLAAEPDARRFADSVGSWPPFQDTVPALRRLKRAHVLGVVSNVDDLSFADTHKALDGLIDEVVTADTVRAYKPDLAHFRAMLERLAARAIARDEVLHVAQSRFHDIAPASEIGLACVWVDRRRGRSGRGLTIRSAAEPDFRTTGLAEVVSLVARLRLGAGPT